LILLHLIAFLSSLGISLVFTRWVRDSAFRNGWLRPPSSSHHIHERAIPRLGGIAIFATVLVVTIVMAGLAKALHVRLATPMGKLLPIISPAALAFLIGVYDDLRYISATRKLLLQIVAASLAYAAGFRVLFVPLLFGSHEFGHVASFLLTVLWIVGITNAFNLIDGLDGLAAGSALFSISTVFVVSVAGANYFTSWIAVCLAGAVLGFLPFNVNPATLFLGDSGSLFLGFMLSILALSGSQTQKSSTLAGIAIPIVALGLPILDTSLAVFRRFISGQSLFAADCDHIHHRLLKRGFTHRQVVLILYGVSALLGLLSLTLMSSNGSRIAIVLLMLGVGIGAGVQALRYPEVLELLRAAERTWEQKEMMVKNVAVRRATDAMAQSQNLTQVIGALINLSEKNDFDAFELNLAPQFSSTAIANPIGMTLRKDATGWNLTWRRDGVLVEGKSDPFSGWKLTLELVTKYQEKCGTLALFRYYNGDTPRIDLGFLTDGLHSRLADALARAAVPRVVSSTPSKDRALAG